MNLNFVMDQGRLAQIDKMNELPGDSSHFFGHYKELRLQRYELFHGKLRDLMVELKGDVGKDEGQEAELKREWKFIKDIVQSLVKANKKIKEHEQREEDRRRERERRYGS